MGKLNDDIAFWHWTRARQAKSGQSWSSYWATLISATVENAAPTHVVLTFPTAQTSLGASDFTITGFTVSSASWTGAVLTLVLSVPVLIFDDNLTITFARTGQTATVTNNVADDGNTAGYYNRQLADQVKLNGGAEEIYWNIISGHSARGAEESSGNLVLYGIYEITAAQANYFYSGCQVGDIFVGDGKSLSASNKVKRVTGNHLGQFDGTKRPISGAFDGSNDFMRCPSFTLSQPLTIYMVMKQKTWTHTEVFLSGVSGVCRIMQYNSTPQIIVFAGGATTGNANLALDTKGIIRAIFNGANSSIQVNNTSPVTSNAGTGNMTGITLGAREDTSVCSDMTFWELIIRTQVDDAATQTAIYNCLARKHGFFLT